MFRNLFNRTHIVTTVQSMPSFDVTATDGAGDGASETRIEREGVFVTPQSLVSFAGATGAVTVIWKSLGIIRPAWGTEPIAALVISLVVGLAIYLINETDPTRPPARGRERVISAFIAIINSLVICSAAVGASEVAAPT